MNNTLSKLKINEIGQVVDVVGERKIRRKLFDMGITPGTNIKLIKKAPLGDPLEVILRGYVLTLRKSEASLIIIKEGV